MLKLIFFVLFVSVARNTVDAAAEVIVAQNKPHKYAYIIGCYMRNLDVVLPYNETLYPKDGSCVKYTCKYDGHVSIDSCIAVYEGSCLRIPGNRSLNYPECCDSIDCRNRNNKPILVQQIVKEPNEEIELNDDENQDIEYEDDNEEEVTEVQTNKKVQNTTSVQNSSIPIKKAVGPVTNKTVIISKVPTISNNSATQNISKAFVKEEKKKEPNIKKVVIGNDSNANKNTTTTTAAASLMPARIAPPKVSVDNKTKTPGSPLKPIPNDRKPVTPTVNTQPTQYVPKSKDIPKPAIIKKATSKLIEEESKSSSIFPKTKVVSESKGTSTIKNRPTVASPVIRSEIQPNKKS